MGSFQVKYLEKVGMPMLSNILEDELHEKKNFDFIDYQTFKEIGLVYWYNQQTVFNSWRGSLGGRTRR